MKEETVGEKLQRLARESLPRHVETFSKDRNSKRRCACGEFLPTWPKIRQKQPVCDDCAAVIPRMIGGKRPTCACSECGATFPRLKLKIKHNKLYCKKCLKLKYNIDF